MLSGSAPDVVVGGHAGALPEATVRAAVHHVLRRERCTARVAVTFVGKGVMRRLNAAYLSHDRATDVIAFPLKQPDGSLAGDIYICRYAAARNARSHRTPVRTELLRLVVHGALHVLGFDHPGGEARTRSAMWRAQERHLAALR
ncbi:MAG: rRNA maturation RNase YbeY [Gemmatimonadales bacterium]